MNEILISSIGYAASFFVVLSFILKDIKYIRGINLIGCFCFVIWGVLSGWLWPIIIPNVILCGIQIYHLFLSKVKE